MTAGQLAIVLATVLCALGFAALVVVLARVLQATNEPAPNKSPTRKRAPKKKKEA